MLKLNINDDFKKEFIEFLSLPKEERNFEKFKPDFEVILKIIENHIDEFKESGLQITFNSSSKKDDNTLKIGDIVILNSGGPLMYVEEINDDIITCGWEDYNGMKTYDKFPSKCLTKNVLNVKLI